MTNMIMTHAAINRIRVALDSLPTDIAELEQGMERRDDIINSLLEIAGSVRIINTALDINLPDL